MILQDAETAPSRDVSHLRIANLGSGERIIEGAVNVDFYSKRADVRHDLNNFPYPFSNDAFDEIHAWNVIEHLDDVITAMHEIHRIGSDGCLIHIRVPHFRSACLYEDLTHRRGFAWRSFDIFTEEGTIYGDYAHCRFEVVSRQYTPYFIPLLYKALSNFPSMTDNLLSKYIPMASIEFVLRVRKA
ncbi:MAG TPA: hypothetical protein DDZ67_10595 [Xanthomonadaceae bacterium]|nr:hypothetical protein [Xanthomonadaceae bacterium]